MNKRGVNSKTPPALNKKWLKAVFFAAISILNTAIRAVAVVPIFAPIIRGTAFSNPRIPCWVKIIARPVVTELDCTIAVNRQPTRIAIKGFCG